MPLKTVRKILLALTLTLLAFMTSLVFATGRVEPINQLNVFGDSLSDVGQVFRATGEMYPPNPPYFQGRYSNGRVWVEYLAERLHLSSRQTNNFAYGGATTGSDRNSLVPGLLTQVQLFTKTHQQPNPNALYVLWAGANDYLQGVSNATVPVENLARAITSLADVGAKNILVANLPDLGHLPATRTSNNSVKFSALTQAHNQGLRRSLKLLSQQYHDLQIVTMDANKLYFEAKANPAALGFTNVISACLSGTRACGNPDQFLFWDSIHPTTAAHRILAERAFSVLKTGHLIVSR
jgi:phospholipase/lecithinase/hemolysin